ncbi:MAG: hypothetical protein MZV63_06070 [Marinilabiliales bacterium]|nr:hypothetical protein [Marinilabiliales bacterium]
MAGSTVIAGAAWQAWTEALALRLHVHGGGRTAGHRRHLLAALDRALDVRRAVGHGAAAATAAATTGSRGALGRRRGQGGLVELLERLEAVLDGVTGEARALLGLRLRRGLEAPRRTSCSRPSPRRCRRR